MLDAIVVVVVDPADMYPFSFPFTLSSSPGVNDLTTLPYRHLPPSIPRIHKSEDVTTRQADRCYDTHAHPLHYAYHTPHHASMTAESHDHIDNNTAATANDITTKAKASTQPPLPSLQARSTEGFRRLRNKTKSMNQYDRSITSQLNQLNESREIITVIPTRPNPARPD